MLTLPDLQAAELRFSLEIEVFVAICATHGVHRGDREDLSAFAWQVSSQPEFQADLAGLVTRLQQRGDLAEPFADILATFLVGISGPSAGDASTQFSSSTDMLVNFLVTLGGWSSEDLRYATALADEIRDELSREQTIQEAEPLFTPKAGTPTLADPASRPVTSDDLRDVIARLEQSNHDLRQKLEAMDERIRRIDPQSDTVQTASASQELPARTTLSVPEGAEAPLRANANSDRWAAPSPPASFTAGISGFATSLGGPVDTSQQTATDTTQPFGQDPVDPSRHQSFARPPHAQATRTGTRLLTDQEHLADQRRISAPFRRRRLVQGTVFASTALVAAGGFLYSSRSHTEAPSLTASQNTTSASPGSRDLLQTAPHAAADASDNPDLSTVPPDPGTPAAGAAASLAPPVTIYSPGYSAGANAPGPRARNSRKPSALTPQGAAGHSASGPIQSSAGAVTRPAGSSEPVSVSSSVMAERLLSSTPPSYPRLARLTSLQGVVVLRATIARDGSVERVRALGGHYLLRDAAANAVRSWRYKPYYLNGRPVEVATLVTIDFALSR